VTQIIGEDESENWVECILLP